MAATFRPVERVILTDHGTKLKTRIKPLTAVQFRAAYEKAGLTQEEFGEILHISPRNVRRYANEESEVPQLTAKVIRLIAAGMLSIEDVAQA
jgi:DNA-binding transcriptional regulator YiaG